MAQAYLILLAIIAIAALATYHTVFKIRKEINAALLEKMSEKK